MIKLAHIEGKTREAAVGGAYDRCFGDADLGRLLSRVQSLIIRNGLELEKIIIRLMAAQLIDDLDAFLVPQIMAHGVRVAPKTVVKKAQSIEGHRIEPDS